MATTLITLGSLIAYGFIGAVTAAVCYRQNRQRYDAEVGAAFAGLAWPVGLFVMLGIYLAQDRPSKAERAEARAEIKTKLREQYLRKLEIQAGVLCPHGREWKDCYRPTCEIEWNKRR